MPLLITACSNRKRVAPEACARDLARGSLDAVGKEWLGRLQQSKRTAAIELYCGRSVRGTERAAELLDAELLFASAGLGWVASSRQIPSYGMTIVPSEDNVLARISDATDAAAWWQWLRENSPFAEHFAEVVSAHQGIVLIALPGSYLAMIEPDLLALSERARRRLRIIQREGAVREDLRPWSLIYDDRLDGSGAWSGTRSDFAARAALHFAAEIWPHAMTDDAAAHAKAVDDTLSAWARVPMRIGSRRDDEELRSIVAQHWDRAGGRSTRLLRILRDELGIACEQGRFARLVRSMRTEREHTR